MKPSERNLGVDLFRVICMLSLVVQHVLGHGWVMNSLNPESWKYALCESMRTMCLFGISGFALISGYVGIQARYRYSALALQWLRVWVYSVLFTAVGALAAPEMVGGAEVTRALFPVLKTQYWYFSAYVGCFLLAPFVRMAMLQMNRRQAGVCVGALVAVFGVFNALSNGDPLYTGGGKATLWLLVLYVVGAYIGRFGLLERVPTGGLLAMSVLAALLCAGINPVAYRLLGVGALGNRFVRVDSPTTTLLAVLMLLLFARVRVTHGRKWVALLGETNFSVYLIHDHPIVRRLVISTYAYHLAGLSTAAILPGVVLASAAVYAVCTAIDVLRVRLFEALRLKQRLSAMETRLIGDLWQDR